jgi:hypothetical protein
MFCCALAESRNLICGFPLICYKMNQLLKDIVSWVFLFGGALVVMADVCIHLLLMGSWPSITCSFLWFSLPNFAADVICKTCYRHFKSLDRLTSETLACGHENAERICEMCNCHSVRNRMLVSLRGRGVN